MNAPDPEHEPIGRRELQHGAVKGALWTGIHTLVSLPLAFGVNVLVARVLGVADYGRLTYLTTVIAIAGIIAGLGVTTALIQFGSKAHASGNPARVRALLSSTQGFRLLVTGPLVAIAVLSLVQVDAWLMAIALVFGVGFPALLSNGPAALLIENRSASSAQITMFRNILIQSSVVISVLVLGTPDAVWSARVVAGGILLALYAFMVSPQYRGALLKPGWPWKLDRTFWVFALPTAAAGIIGALVSNRTEIVFLDWFADERAMGLFGLAFGLAGHVYAPAQAFIGPLVPAVSALVEVDQEAARRAFLRVTRSAAAVGGLVVVAVLPSLASLVSVIYGAEFAAASELLIIIGFGSASMLIGSPHKAFLMARLGGRRLLWINTLSLIVNLVLALVLIPVFGAMGAAITCAGAVTMQSLQLTKGEARALQIPISLLISSLMPMFIAFLIVSASWLAVDRLEIGQIQGTIILVISGPLLYAIGLRLTRTGISRHDAEAIQRSLPIRIRRVARAGIAPLAHSQATE